MEDQRSRRECASCGATAGLLRCSRCRREFFCSAACQRQYWPVHRSECRANDFASAIEATEPRFAAWMRQHGKQAVLKDEEVDRLERASRAVCALPSRAEVLDSMYGRADPRPAPPSYSPEELAAMAAEQHNAAVEALLLTPQDLAWRALPPTPAGLGVDCGAFRWRQTLSHVRVELRLPPDCAPSQVKVQLERRLLKVTQARSVARSGAAAGRESGGEVLLGGTLTREVEPPGCLWLVGDDGIVHVTLLKRSRPGRYCRAEDEAAPSPLLITQGQGAGGGRAASQAQAGGAVAPRRAPATAADTFWPTLFVDAPDACRLRGEHPPTGYYVSADDDE